MAVGPREVGGRAASKYHHLLLGIPRQRGAEQRVTSWKEIKGPEVGGG